ncbi:transposase [Streptomyces sp. NPDC002817]|uniref:transposase n=1 Tax=Streptomyces sp. NPDC088357 TaxID=3154655 RepID=UPI003417F5F7
MASARRTLVALVAGERDPDVFSEPAPGTLRGKSPVLNTAPACFYKVRAMLEAVGRTTAGIEGLSAEIDRQPAPYRRRIELLVPVPGPVLSAAEVVPAEIGPDVSRFPAAGHLASWTGMCRGNHESAAGNATAPPGPAMCDSRARWTSPRCPSPGHGCRRTACGVALSTGSRIASGVRDSPADPG